MPWRFNCTDSFHFSARIRAPPGTEAAAALRVALTSLLDGPLATDQSYLLPPCLPVRARVVPGTNLLLLYVVLLDAHSIRAVAVASSGG